MALQAPAMQMFHCSGHTEVCYNRSGTTFYSCGEDGGIRIWKHLEDEDHQTLEIGETVRSLRVLGNKVFAGTESNTVQSYLLPDGSPDGILCRFTAPVTHIDLSEDGKKLVAGAGDFMIKVIDLQDTSDQVILQAHSAPILSVAIDPLTEFVASTSCDGSLKIWNISDKSWEKSIVLFPKCSDISLSKTLARIAWKPKDGQLLAIPLEREIQLYERDSWDVLFTLKIEEETLGVTSVVSWCPDGVHLASITSVGFINVWNTSSKKCIKSFKERKDLPLRCVVWNPKTGTSLAFTNNLGQIGILDQVLDGSDQQTKSKPESKETKEDFTDLFDDMADDDLLDAVTQAERKLQEGSDEDMDEDMNLDPDADLRRKDKSLSNLLITDDTSQDGSNIADDTSASVVTEPKSLPPLVTGPKPTPLQKPFIPSSTPVHLSSRFMKWNMVGVIRCYDTDEESSIDVEFHDTSVHHSLHFDNQLNHNMADVNSQAVLLATEGDEDTPSQIRCQYFASWDTQKEWSISMPKDEIVKALALGKDFLAVGTNKRHVRIFTLSGIQKDLFCLPGPVVTMAADEQKMIIVYHQGPGLPGDQCLGFQLYQLSKNAKAVVVDSRLPLSAKSTLTWLGFTVEGTAASVDSNGIVRLYNQQSSAWISVANTKSHTKGKSDHHWIIGMQESPAQIRCVSCKGSTFPPTLPRPTPILLPFQLPLCDLEADKGQLEEMYLREKLMAGTNTAGQDTLMKMFALSCRAEREVRAADVCKMMTTQHAWTLAIKYASRSRKMLLAEKLSEMAAELLRAESEDEESEDEDDTWQRRRNDPRRERSDMEEDDHQEEEEEEEDEDADQDDDMPEMKPIPTKHRPLVMKPKQKPSLIPLTPISTEKRNPFKKSASDAAKETQEEESPTLGGANVFDNMKKRPSNSTDGQKNKKNQKKDKTPPSLRGTKKAQMTLSSMGGKKQEKLSLEGTKSEPKSASQKPASAFQLWFEENKSTIAAEHPEVESETEIFKLAIQKWREVDTETKQKWNHISSNQGGKETEEKDVESKDESPAAGTTTDKKRKREEDDKENNNNEKKLKAKNVFAKSGGGSLNKSTINKLANFARD
ncbi:WD repeat and HMG-box DNA-binding protein 1-like isoform X2 [Apostichopus japonicus]|uniref:WD repeat and HMG-box DNA-binding protein 1-like isoform X2 n=1 Tax=Stichopus japonicus TaxID=307972 RepID=UPI003AB57CDC